MPRPRMGRRQFIAQAAGTSVVLNELSGSQPAVAAEARPPSTLPAVDLGELSQAVQSVIASKRIGRPVFARLTFQSASKEEIAARLAGMVEAVRGWIDQPLDRVQAVGTAASGQVCLTLQFRGGATALVSYAQGKTHGDGVDLLLLGNHGAVYHDAGAGALWDADPQAQSKRPDSKLQSAIEQALQTGKPVALE